MSILFCIHKNYIIFNGCVAGRGYFMAILYHFLIVLVAPSVDKEVFVSHWLFTFLLHNLEKLLFHYILRK